MEDDRKSMSDWVENREAGRRETDRYQCAMHDYLTNKNDHCFDIIKQSIKDEVQRRDHKFDVLETRLEQYISKWALGMIVSISITLFGGLLGFAIWEIQTMHKQLQDISVKVSATTNSLGNDVYQLKMSLTDMNVTQKGILHELEKLAPEHARLMQHMEEHDRIKNNTP